MQFLKREQIQLGRTGWLLGDLSNLLAGALLVFVAVSLSMAATRRMA